MKGHETKSNRVYDYCAVLYPEGLISSDNFILFDKENIDTVIFKEYGLTCESHCNCCFILRGKSEGDKRHTGCFG